MAKSKLAKFKQRRRRRNIAAEATSESKDLAISIGAGFAGYATTRFLSRATYSQVVKRFPGGADYAALVASAIGAAGTYFGTKYWSKVSDYHEAASVGAGIALLQAGVQTFLPKFSWIVSDVAPEQYVKAPKTDESAMTADMLPPVEAETAQAGFDLGRLLAENPELEAVPLTQGPPAPGYAEPQGDDEMSLIYDDDYAGGMLQ